MCVSLTFKFSLKLQHLLLFEASSVEESYCFERKGMEKLHKTTTATAETKHDKQAISFAQSHQKLGQVGG